MNRSKRKFVLIYKDMLADPDFRKLPSAAKVLYIYLRNKYHPDNVNPASGIPEVKLRYREMSGVLCPESMSRAFSELIQANFIAITQKGGKTCPSAYRFAGQWAFFPEYQKKKA
ncbi:MAG: hypothetical protein V1681_02265 [Candidatus Neomarinimicrobiota bacterium]